MGLEFDGPNKIISLTTGTTGLDCKDLYSRWKDWVKDSGGSKFLEAFSIVGGEPIDVAASTYVATYLFLVNGWFIRPQEANHKLKVYNGVLLTQTGDDPFLQTIGTFNVLVQYSQPVQAQSVIVETGVSGLTEAESSQLAEISTVSTKSDGLSADLATKLTTSKFLALK